jgi:hypothetical protein
MRSIPGEEPTEQQHGVFGSITRKWLLVKWKFHIQRAEIVAKKYY